MQPPVKLEDLTDEWIKDAPFDETEPQKTLAQIPILHAKYLKILSHHSMLVKKLTIDFNRMRYLKIEYYTGNLNNTEDLSKYGWEPYYKSHLKSELGPVLDHDDDLTKILLKKVYHEEIVETCKGILKEINNRTWSVRSFIDWQKFTNGS